MFCHFLERGRYVEVRVEKGILLGSVSVLVAWDSWRSIPEWEHFFIRPCHDQVRKKKWQENWHGPNAAERGEVKVALAFDGHAQESLGDANNYVCRLFSFACLGYCVYNSKVKGTVTIRNISIHRRTSRRNYWIPALVTFCSLQMQSCNYRSDRKICTAEASRAPRYVQRPGRGTK